MIGAIGAPTTAAISSNIRNKPDGSIGTNLYHTTYKINLHLKPPTGQHTNINSGVPSNSNNDANAAASLEQGPQGPRTESLILMNKFINNKHVLQLSVILPLLSIIIILFGYLQELYSINLIIIGWIGFVCGIILLITKFTFYTLRG